jgi:hypothetical protein
MADQDPDDQIDHTHVRDEPMDDVAIHRARAASVLDQIARQSKQTLVAAGIDIDVFFLVPSSGDAVIIVGCPGDPSDAEWDRVAELVASIVRQSVGLAGTRCRAVACATTQDQECCDAIA